MLSDILTSNAATSQSFPTRPNPFKLRAPLYMALAISPLCLLAGNKLSSKSIGQKTLFHVSRLLLPLQRGAWISLGGNRAPKRPGLFTSLLRLVAALSRPPAIAIYFFVVPALNPMFQGMVCSRLFSASLPYSGRAHPLGCDI